VFPLSAGAFLDLGVAPGSAVSGLSYLHPTEVIEASSSHMVVECARPQVELSTGMALKVLFEQADGFRQQEMCVRTITPCARGLRVALGTRSTASPAERRRSPRLACEGIDLSARLGQQLGGPVVDLGRNGFAVRTDARYCVGEVLPVALSHHGEDIACTVIVRNVRELDGGSTQYGVFCEDPFAGAPPRRLIDVYGAVKHGVLVPLRSSYECDPEMMDLVREFATEIQGFASEVERLLSTKDWPHLQMLAHTLKGAGGGYGFDRITEVAGSLETAIAQADDTQELANRAERLCVTLRAVRVSAEPDCDTMP